MPHKQNIRMGSSRSGEWKYVEFYLLVEPFPLLRKIIYSHAINQTWIITCAIIQSCTISKFHLLLWLAYNWYATSIVGVVLNFKYSPLKSIYQIASTISHNLRHRSYQFEFCFYIYFILWNFNFDITRSNILYKLLCMPSKKVLHRGINPHD